MASVTVAAAAAVGVAVPLAPSNHSQAKAYAVTKDANGSITDQIYRLTDSAGVERALRANGIRSDITFTPVGKMCRQPRCVRSNVGRGVASLDFSHGLKFTFYAPIPTAGTWAIEYSGDQAKPAGPSVRLGHTLTVRSGIAQGPVAPCLPTNPGSPRDLHPS